MPSACFGSLLVENRAAELTYSCLITRLPYSLDSFQFQLLLLLFFFILHVDLIDDVCHILLIADPIGESSIPHEYL